MQTPDCYTATEAEGLVELRRGRKVFRRFYVPGGDTWIHSVRVCPGGVLAIAGKTGTYLVHPESGGIFAFLPYRTRGRIHGINVIDSKLSFTIGRDHNDDGHGIYFVPRFCIEDFAKLKIARDSSPGRLHPGEVVNLPAPWTAYRRYGTVITKLPAEQATWY